MRKVLALGCIFIKDVLEQMNIMKNKNGLSILLLEFDCDIYYWEGIWIGNDDVQDGGSDWLWI